MPFSSDPSIVIAQARWFVGRAAYRLTARLEEAPVVVNCLTLVALCYKTVGLELSASTLEGQLDQGLPVDRADLQPGDLIFTSGRQSYFKHPRYGSLGHVGLYTGQGTVIHATNRRGCRGVIEDSLEFYLREGGFRIACRILAKGDKTWAAA